MPALVTHVQASHVRALRSLAAEVRQTADLASAAALIERRLSETLGRRCPVTFTSGSPLRERHRPAPIVRPAPRSVATAGEIETGGAAESPMPTRRKPEATTSESLDPAGVDVSLGEHGGREWWLRLAGEWNSPRAERFVELAGDLLHGALDAPALRERAARAEDVVTAAFAFSRGLAKVRGGHALRQFIVDTLARATRARLGALALMDPAEGVLHIAATHGYPALLVEHVRVAPGDGILGGVVASRRPLLVPDVRRLAGFPRRPRYRTPSFLAVPLLANDDVLGVVTFADRHDARAFDEHDLTAARALAAPAALALQNDRLSEQARQLAHAATVDPLTGLFNRRHFHSRIEEEIERARRHGLDLSLLLIDIDDFKRINDTLGHLAGDYLLKQVAEVLKRSVRVFDVCTRYGGEEFAILMPGSSAANALLVAERIRSRVESASREEGPLPPHIRITVSLGLAVLGHTEASSQDLIARADRALYRAKEEGKNQVRMDPG
jgi:diguanylate cyclase (GGDEF)-like protein